MSQWVVIPDLHYPYHDPDFVALTEEIVKMTKCTGIVQLGDALDFFQISTYPKDPARKNSIHEDMLLYSEQIDRWVKIGGKHLKYFYQLEGNHCYRLSRYISTKAPEVYAIIKSVPAVLEFPERNRGGEIRFRWFDYSKWDACKIGQTVLHHGFYFDRHVAVNNLKRYPCNFIQGHTHRYQYATDGDRFSVSLGHGSKASVTTHVPTPCDWQSALGILHVDGTKQWFEPVLVQDGKAMFRGQPL